MRKQAQQYALDDVRFDAARFQVLDAGDDVGSSRQYTLRDDVPLAQVSSALPETRPAGGVGVRIFLHIISSAVSEKS